MGEGLTVGGGLQMGWIDWGQGWDPEYHLGGCSVL
jgi:hypothetical protein